MNSNPLRLRLGRVRRRLLMISLGSGVAWGLIAAIVLLLAGVWFDLLWEFSPGWRIATLWASGVTGLAAVLLLIRAARVAGRNPAVARRLDRAGETGGEILSGLELDSPGNGPWLGIAGRGSGIGDRGEKTPTLPAPIPSPQSPSPESPVSEGLAQLAVDRAAHVAGTVSLAAAAPAKPLARSVAVLAGLLTLVGLLAVCLPGLALTQWQRFTDPHADKPPFSQTTFDVTPRDPRVDYGSELPIVAIVRGFATARGVPVEQVELVMQRDGQREETVPMFHEPDGRWRAAIASVTEPATYFVRSYRSRSEKYRIDVITVPRIEQVRVKIIPPAYTREKPYEGPVPSNGIAGLPGTEVQVFASSNRPLSRGEIRITSADKQQVDDVEMTPVDDDSQEVTGSFTVTGDGKLELRVFDQPGTASQQSFSSSITLLADQKPFIRLVKPKKRSLATPSVMLPVVIDAEDDYGISRVQLYRSLNDSRPLPMEVVSDVVTLDQLPPRRARDSIYLPLAKYGLVPGDVIKLFGRVEDNEPPPGPKGSESAVVTIQIISQEDFERRLRVREGMQVLMSKYAAARRRMEGLAKEAEGLRKKMGDPPSDKPVEPEARRQLQRLIKQLRKDSEELRKSAAHKLPYDIDENLTPQLEDVARLTAEMADELEKMLRESELLEKRLAEKLEEMSKKLGAKRKDFDQQVTLPLEHLAAVFPLLADQSRFVALALHQQDLAERLASLNGRDGEDDPALKTRMRDLEQEQRQVREQLGNLLDDIVDHVERLPDDPMFDGLRDTAAAFARDVRASGALEAMVEAETGLAEFSGTRGHENAQKAADILDKFVKRCQGGGSDSISGAGML